VQAEDGNISSNFDTRQVENVPNPGGDLTYIAQIAPGITINTSSGGGFGNFSAFGLPEPRISSRSTATITTTRS